MPAGSDEEREEVSNADLARLFREYLMSERRALLTRLDAIDKMLGLKPKKGRSSEGGGKR